MPRRSVLANHLRLPQSSITLFVITMIVFAMMYAVGDPVALLLPRTASQSDRAELREELGLDRPIVVQYGNFLARLSRGDLV